MKPDVYSLLENVSVPGRQAAQLFIVVVFPDLHKKLKNCKLAPIAFMPT